MTSSWRVTLTLALVLTSPWMTPTPVHGQTMADVVHDVIFLVDASYSIREDHFRSLLGAVLAYIEQLPVATEYVHVGVIAFSERTEVVPLTGNLTSLRRDIPIIYYEGRSTDTKDAFSMAQAMLQSARSFRSGATQSVVIITDGVSKDPPNALKAAEVLLSEGVRVYSVGIGRNVRLLELVGFTGGNITRLFRWNRFDVLPDIDLDIGEIPVPSSTTSEATATVGSAAASEIVATATTIGVTASLGTAAATAITTATATAIATATATATAAATATFGAQTPTQTASLGTPTATASLGTATASLGTATASLGTATASLGTPTATASLGTPTASLGTPTPTAPLGTPTQAPRLGTATQTAIDGTATFGTATAITAITATTAAVDATAIAPTATSTAVEGTAAVATAVPTDGTAVTPTSAVFIDGTAVTPTSTVFIDGTAVTPTSAVFIGGTAVTPTSAVPTDGTAVTPTSAVPTDGTAATPTSAVPTDGTAVVSTSAVPTDGTAVTPTSAVHTDGTAVTPTSAVSIGGTAVTPTSAVPIDGTEVTPTQAVSIDGTAVTPTSAVYVTATDTAGILPSFYVDSTAATATATAAAATPTATVWLKTYSAHPYETATAPDFSHVELTTATARLAPTPSSPVSDVMFSSLYPGHHGWPDVDGAGSNPGDGSIFFNRSDILAGLCVDSAAKKGFGYLPLVTDAGSYLQCFLSDLGDVTAVIRRCPSGQLWEQRSLTCVQPSGGATSLDMCDGKVLGTTYKMPGGCGLHWECDGGVAIARSCPPYHAYFPQRGCVWAPDCPYMDLDRCDVGDECESVPLEDKSGYRVPVLGGWMVQPCLYGLVFDLAACACVSHRPTLRGSSFAVQINVTDPLGHTPTLCHAPPHVPRPLGLSFRYRPDDVRNVTASGGGGEQVLVRSRWCSREGLFIVTEDDQAIRVRIFSKSGYVMGVSLPVQGMAAGEWRSVDVNYVAGHVRLEVSVPGLTYSTLAKNGLPVIVGGCGWLVGDPAELSSKVSELSGEIADVYISQCTPRQS